MAAQDNEKTRGVNTARDRRVKRSMAKQYPILPASPHYTPVDNDDGIVIDVIDEDEERTRVEEITVISDATRVYAFEVETLLNCGHLTLDQVIDIIKRSPPKVTRSR